MRGLAIALAVAAPVVACGGDEPSGRPAASEAAPRPSATRPLLVDVTGEVGVDFSHFADATAERRLPETMGAGVALFDYDGDGDADLFLANGTHLEPGRAADGPGAALYRNDGGHFVEVGERAGVSRPLYAMGVAVGDVDGDGALDLFVTGVGGDRLYRNRGDGTFEDATAAAGVGGEGGFGASAAFLDADGDGDLDLFAGRYVVWSPEGDVPCSPDGETRVYCTPEVYPPVASRFYRNRGDGTFEEWTAESGVGGAKGKSLGVVTLDADRDGWTDLAVANDTTRDFLFLNRAGAGFREAGVEAGVAFGPSGSPRGGMGIDAAPLDDDALADLVVGNFSLEMSALLIAGGEALFVDEAPQRGIGVATLMHLAFGTLAVDVDGDGPIDLLFANGHIEPEIERIRPPQSYAQPLQLFRNDGRGRFDGVQDVEGSALRELYVGRGLAAADLDLDGDPDLVLTQNGRSARVLRNDARPASRVWLELLGGASAHPPYGASLRARAGERLEVVDLASGRSYLSASEPVARIGLGGARRVDRLEVTWPSGRRQRLLDLPAGRGYRLREPR